MGSGHFYDATVRTDLPLPSVRVPPTPCLDKLNRVSWTAGVYVRAYGCTIGIRTTDAAVLPAIVQHLPTGARTSAPRGTDHLVSWVVGSDADSRLRRFHILYAGAQRLVRTFDPNEVLRVLAHHVELAVAEMAVGRLFLHAGVVGWKGRALVIPGPSHSGKSSLVAALLAQGATYYSDEYAVLDSSGQVRPYPRALHLRDRGELGEAVPAATLGARTGRTPLPVGLVAMARYHEGSTWEPRALSPGRAVMALLANSISIRKKPARTLATLECVARGAVTLEGTRGEAPATAARLLETLERIPEVTP
jgi:hypothetical protein